MCLKVKQISLLKGKVIQKIKIVMVEFKFYTDDGINYKYCCLRCCNLIFKKSEIFSSSEYLSYIVNSTFD